MAKRATHESDHTQSLGERAREFVYKGVTVVVLGGSAIFLAGCASPDAGASSGSGVGIEVDASTPWYERMNLNPTDDQIRIGADSVSPDQLPNVFFGDRTTVWMNSGYTPEFARNAIDNQPEFQGMSAQRSGELDQRFVGNLVCADAVSKPGVAGFIADMVEFHKDTAYIGALTSFPELMRADKEMYGRFAQITQNNGVEVVKNDDGSIASVTFNGVLRHIDNADLNRAGEELTRNTSLDPVYNNAAVSAEWLNVNNNYCLNNIELQPAA